jgi:hypothetical protein
MATTDKNIVITPNIGQTADPKVVYSGANATVGAQTITLYVYPDNSGTLSWEGSAGQLMSVTNTLTGTIFAVNDVSGIPSITVQDTGQVTLAPYTGNLVIGNVTDANTAKVQVTGTVSATGNITAPFFIGNGSALTGITSSGGSSITNGTSNVVVAASANVTVGVAGTAAVTTFATTGLFVTGLASVTGNVQGGNLRTAGLISATGAINGAAITGTSLTVSTGNITGGNIVNANANGVGNIGTTGGFFNTVFAKATSAQYADVAEKYRADAQYVPGTVLEIGGSAEVTATTDYASTRIAGVVSTNPAFIMNSSETSENSVELALLGRIPCRVVGKIERGDMLCSSRIAGVATALNENLYKPGAVIGKALESYNSVSDGVIEILVGRL